MKPTVTRGATHKFTAPENWNTDTEGPCGDLQVRAECFGEREIVELFSTWKPDESELAHLNAGGVIEISICLPNQPVMSVGVVDPVDPSLLKYIAPQDSGAEPVTDKPAITINEHAHGDDSHEARRNQVGGDTGGEW